MDIKKICGFIFIFSHLYASCKKDECIGNSYALKETWSVTPIDSNIHIGDTLLINSEFSNAPFDFYTNKNVDFSGGSLIGSNFIVYSFKTGVGRVPAVDSFSFIPIIGSVYSENNNTVGYSKLIYYSEIGNMYKLKFKIAPLKKGIYVITIADGLARRKNNSCEDGAGILFTTGNTDNHIYLEEQFYGTTNIPESDRTHSYCFRVN